MHVFYLEKNSYKLGKINTESGNSIELVLPSGGIKKINKRKNLFILVNENTNNFIEKVELKSNSMDVNSIWKLAPKSDFTLCELNKILSPEEISVVNKAALLICLVKNPIYFRKKQNGFFSSVPAKIIRSAKKSLQLKEENIRIENFLIDQVMNGELPERIKNVSRELVFADNKQSMEYRVIKKVSSNLGLRPLNVLFKIGVLKSAFEFHKLNFFNKLEKKSHYTSPATYEKNKNNLFEGFKFPISSLEAYSIDDISTTEIDDAFSLQRINQASVKWKVGIHIALPTMFLTPFECAASGISDQALSIYTPSEKKTMLPHDVLEKSSLDENNLRPVISLYVEFDKKGLILGDKTVLEKIFIKQNIRLGKWEEQYDKNPETTQLPWDGLRDLSFLASILSKKRRIKKSSKNINKPEFRVTVTGRKIKNFKNIDTEGVPFVELRKRDSIADIVVTEFMILTNSIWGKKLKNSQGPAIYRVNSTGFTKMQTKAELHKDLGVEVYAWATSPLRRYVDFLNQWQLVCSIIPKKKSSFVEREKIEFEIKNFGKKQILYNEFQKLMEKYWAFRWLISKNSVSSEFWKKTKENRIILEAECLGHGQFCLLDIPLNFRLIELCETSIGEKIRVEVESIDCLDMKVKLCRA